ncbi:hypothetical protein TWF281_011950 [Arthrobotrys megalospora]
MRSVRAGFRTIPALRSLVFSRSLPEHTVIGPGTLTKSRVNTLATQAFPLKGFYQLLLEHPQAPSEHPAYYPSRSAAKPTGQPASNPPKQADPESQLTRAQLVFGSRLVGPLRVRSNDPGDQAQMIAGVLVPPKPKEPDNCCMSGCVNCVWDVFREDLEDWAAANARAHRALQLQSEGETLLAASGKNSPIPRGVINKGREVGGQSQGQGVTFGTNMWEGLEDIPIGIRVFMDTEKAIKSRKPGKSKVGSAS